MYLNIWNTPIFTDMTEIIEKLRLEKPELMYDIDRKGDDIFITCPFHKDGQEKTPSCSINLINKIDRDGNSIPAGTVHCFGCGYGSDLPTFISNIFNKKDGGRFGYKWLMKNFKTGEFEDRKIHINLTRNKEIKYETFDVSKYPFNYNYLQYRGIQKQLMYLYNIRYDSNRNAVVFPIYDINENIIGLHKKFIAIRGYVNEGITNYLYGITNLIEHKSLWLTEGPLDCLSCVQNGHNAVAFLGTPSKRQLKQLEKLPYRIFISAFDNDEAGDKATEKIKHYFNNKIIKRAEFIGGADPNDIIGNFTYKLENLI